MQLLPNPAINKRQWDECIEASQQNIIYAKSFYLDNLCKGWSALTGEDYNWVMPLTHQSKWGIAYLYQPPFTQQLGLFSKPGIEVPFEEIIDWLQGHYKFWEVSWNSSYSPQSSSALNVKEATNLILSLASSYESIAEEYSGSLLKNLKRTAQFNLQYKATSDFESCLALFKQHYGSRIPHVKSSDYRNFSKLCSYALQHNMLVCRQALNVNGEVMAAALLLRDNKRLYNMLNTTTIAGRKIEANHFLLDAIIKEFAGSNLLFDFEGSDIPGVKSFYESFGAVNQPYYMLRYNALPGLVRWVKG